MAEDIEYYDILDLIEDFKELLSLKLNTKINDTTLSRILGMGNRYIYRIKQEINDKGFYSITEKTINRWKENVRNPLTDYSQNIIDLIEKFEISQKFFPFAQRTNFHPNLKYDYFDEINTKEKAYWLGLLYADGNVGKDDRISFSQNTENSVLVYWFANAIGFNIERIEVIESENKLQVRIGNKRFAAGLRKYGCVSAKSKLIELPTLDNRELYLAFLLGYFDGDGTIGTSKITSGSIKFLQQIKKMFNIKNKIHSRKGAYDLHLGANLFNEMLENFHNSLPRKRIRLETSEERIDRLLEEREKIYKKAAKLGGLASRKFHITKKELKELLSYMSIPEIAEKYGVAISTVYRRIKELDIR